jgi:hypothetical protein
VRGNVPDVSRFRLHVRRGNARYVIHLRIRRDDTRGGTYLDELRRNHPNAFLSSCSIVAD